MKYEEIDQAMGNRGVFFSMPEYVFALLTTTGETDTQAYALAFEADEYHRVKGSEDEKDFFAHCTKAADALARQQHIVQLKAELQYHYKKLVQDAALNLDDIELTSNDVKKVLASFLRDRIDDPSSASVKELVDLLRMYQPYLPDDVSASNFQRHFIQIHEPFNALCTKCNREISAFKGLSCECEHCGQRYIWSENDERFYPEMGNL